MPKQTLLVDFDGVLHDYHGWTGKEAIGRPIEGSRGAMYRLEKVYRLICFTTRPPEEAEKWLRHYGFPHMKVTSKKEPAFLIIDDRAITFKGVWTPALLLQITSFTPHWHADHPDTQCPSEAGPESIPALSPPQLE